MLVRRLRSGSWADPRDAACLGAVLRERLARRIADERGLFITLTYAREPWADARACYRAASEERHVREFIRRLRREFPACRKAPWMCKLEFQEDGFPHWHLVILGPRFIDGDRATQLWGYGFSKVKALRSEHASYLAKYVSKTGGVPGWVKTLRPRSFKVVRVSPGFWGEQLRPRDRSEPDPPTSQLEADRRNGLPVYKPLGLVLEERRAKVVCHDAKDFAFRTYAVDLSTIATDRDLRCVPCVDDAAFKGWFVVLARTSRGWQRATFADIERAASRASGRGPFDSIRLRNPRPGLPPGCLDPSLSADDLEWVSSGSEPSTPGPVRSRSQSLVEAL
jgi:hypothetical protein